MQNDLIYGVGINDLTREKGSTRTPYYRAWVRMLERCYSEKYHATHPTYKECLVSDDWHVFSNFMRWMKKQDWQGKSLDKDIIEPSNKIYSKEKCVFVSKELNNLLTDNGRKKDGYPTGVCWNGAAKKVMSRISVNGFQRTLGFLNLWRMQRLPIYQQKRNTLKISPINKKTRE